MNIAEAVTYLHPDKICDIISDTIVDECITCDDFSPRVAIEVIGGHGLIVLIGEITADTIIDFQWVAKETYKKLTGEDIVVLDNIAFQSPEIKEKVDNGGAGDQGLMIGYACNENDMQIPSEMYYARKLLQGFNVDGKSQVIVKGKSVESVVLSVQGQTQDKLESQIDWIIPTKGVKKYCNNIGSFNIGGFEADSGCTGRKIVADAYGGRVPVGGGAFSGKDPTKVDRSAAYMARYIAKRILKHSGAHEVLVKLGYVIGKAEPLLKEAYIDGVLEKFPYDCRPQAIIERFDLLRPIYADTAKNGHFGREGLPWEQV
jgi:S-adenosylmethionine synthetase